MIAYTLSRPTPLERALCKKLSSREVSAHWTVYPNKEEMVVVPSVHSGEEVVVIGRTAPPASNLFRTLLLIDALKNGGAQKITAVIPYFGYSRHDRPFEQGGSCAATLIAALLKTAGATSIVTADIHSGAIEKAGRIPLRNLSMLPAMAEQMKRNGLSVTTIVSPDRGGRERSEVFAHAYGNAVPVIWCEKIRGEDGLVKTTELRGEPVGTHAVIVDDLLDTGRTVEAAAERLRAHGVKQLSLCVTHPIFSGPAVERIARIGFEQIITTNTIPLGPAAKRLEQITVLDATRLFLDGLVQ